MPRQRAIKSLKECPACGNMFFPGSYKQKTCSKACSMNHMRKYFKKKCKVCKRIFYPHYGNQKFCSQQCAGIGKRKYFSVDEKNPIDKRYFQMPWLDTYCIQKKGQCVKYDKGFDLNNTDKGCWGNHYTGNCYVEPMEAPRLILRTNFQYNIYRL